MLLHVVVASAVLAMCAAGPIFPRLCNQNYAGRYYVADTFLGPGKSALVSTGVRFPQAESLCEVFGMRLANFSESDVAGITRMATLCLGPNASAFFGIFESLPTLQGACNLVRTGLEAVYGFLPECSEERPVICEVPLEPVSVSTTTETVSWTYTYTRNVTDTITEVSAATSTEYYVTDTTVTITEESTTYTTVVATTVSCSTATRLVPNPCACWSSSSSSSSSLSSSQFCPCPVHRPHRDHIIPFGSQLHGGKRRHVVDQAPVYTPCGTVWSNYAVVHVTQYGAASPADICALQGWHLANITKEVLSGLYSGVLQPCAVNGTIFGSFYQYSPPCGFLADDSTVVFAFDATASLICGTIQYVLCRIGPPFATTSSVFTGPFTTDSFTKTRHEIHYVGTTTTLDSSTTTTTTQTDTASVDVTTRTRTATETDPVTATVTASTKTLSCCCNPTVCVTTDACCLGPTPRHPRRQH